MKILLSTLVLLSALLAFACDDAAVRGSGNLVTENFDFEDFTKVEIANTFRADISRSDAFSVSVEVDDNILELIEVTQDGDTLRLQLESGTSVTSATLQGEHHNARDRVARREWRIPRNHRGVRKR